jgi:hypothetical protein
MAEVSAGRSRSVSIAATLRSAMYAVALAIVASACSTDPGGHVFTAVNESDHPVIVDIATDQHRMVELPAHSRGVLSEDWTGPTGERPWRLAVLDADCAEIASVSVTRPYLHLQVAADGSVEWDLERTYRPTSSGIRWAGKLEDADCR